MTSLASPLAGMSHIWMPLLYPRTRRSGITPPVMSAPSQYRLGSLMSVVSNLAQVTWHLGSCPGWWRAWTSLINPRNQKKIKFLKRLELEHIDKQRAIYTQFDHLEKAGGIGWFCCCDERPGSLVGNLMTCD